VAEELGRFLAGEPIRARLEAGRGAWRWREKHAALMGIDHELVAAGAVIFAMRSQTTERSESGKPAIAFTFADRTSPNPTGRSSSKQTTRDADRRANRRWPTALPRIITRLAQIRSHGFHVHRRRYMCRVCAGQSQPHVGLLAAVQEGIDSRWLSVVAVQRGRRYLAPPRAMITAAGLKRRRALTARDFSAQAGSNVITVSIPTSPLTVRDSVRFAVGATIHATDIAASCAWDNWTFEARVQTAGRIPHR